MEDDDNGRNLFGGDVLEEFSERFADGEDFSEIVGGEIGAGGMHIGSSAANLDYADNASVRKNGGADNFLNGVHGLTADVHAFEDAGVAHTGESVVNFGAAFARGFRGQRGGAGERYKANVFQGFGDKEVQMLPFHGNSEDGDFFRFHA